jgi:hypothetical protein
MSDFRADDDRLDDDDRLPWLEAVDEDEQTGGPSALKLIVSVIIGLVAIGLVIGGVFWLRDRGVTEGKPEVIAAPKGDYKVRPTDPGGMKVEGTGETAFAASGGAEPRGRIDVDAVPEAPVSAPPKTVPAPPPAPAAVATPPSTPPAKAATPKPAETPPAAEGTSIQLGAFSSQAAATSAWKALSTRFKYLEPLSYSVTPVTSNGRTLYRLRASGPNAAALCSRLRVAGESCVAIG